MASKLKRRLGLGCGIITLLSMGFVAGVVFVLGVLINFDRRANDWQSEESQRFIANHLQKYLKLSAEQRQEIEPIIREGLKERWQLRRDYYEQTDRLFVENYIPRINEFLDAGQKQSLQKRLAHWRKDHLVTGADPTPAATTAPAATATDHSDSEPEQTRKDDPAIPAKP